MTKVVVAPQARGVRIDQHLAAVLPELTRSRLKTLIEEGRVTLAGKPVRAALRLKGGEALEVDVPVAQPTSLAAQDLPLKVIYQDADLLVLDKAAGMVVHPGAGNRDGTLVNALLFHVSDLAGIGGELRPGIVHRLDKDTSGLLVVAKTDRAHVGLARQFADHSIERRYVAAVSGVPTLSAGTIEGALARSTSDRKKVAIVRDGRGKPATTHWKKLKAWRDAAMVECQLETGRTHQVRVHMASIGHPLLGDPVYGRAPHQRLRELLVRLEFRRQALHAARLGFIHPITKDRLSFDSAVPSDMQQLFSALGV